MLGKLSANWRSASSTLGAAFTLPFLCFGLEEWKREQRESQTNAGGVFLLSTIETQMLALGCVRIVKVWCSTLARD